jgi:hypothetical protein
MYCIPNKNVGLSIVPSDYHFALFFTHDGIEIEVVVAGVIETVVLDWMLGFVITI